MTLVDGYGGSKDWLALAATGSADTSYLQWTYVGAGVTTRTWTVTAPSTAGTYEFRLFLNNGYTRVATSPVLTVDPSLNPAPIASALSPSQAVVGGTAFTLAVTGSKFISSSIVRWNGANRPTTFVSATQLQASIGSADIAALGTAQVTVFTPAPAGGTSAPLTFTVSSPPTLTPNITTAVTGATVTVTLANGFGGSRDWLALASTSAANTSYLGWTYVGAGLFNRTWSVAMPSNPGTYEFRLFTNDGYTRVATSPTIVVVPGPPALSSLSPGSTIVGASAFTLTLNGSGFVSSSVVRWNGANRTTTFVNSSQLRAAIPASDVASAGTAAVTVFSPPPGGGTSGSLPFSVVISTAAIAVSATSVAGGTSITANLTNGFGGASDWLALAATSAPNKSNLGWIYVGAGVTTKSWTIAAPTAPGTRRVQIVPERRLHASRDEPDRHGQPRSTGAHVTRTFGIAGRRSATYVDCERQRVHLVLGRSMERGRSCDHGREQHSVTRVDNRHGRCSPGDCAGDGLHSGAWRWNLGIADVHDRRAPDTGGECHHHDTGIACHRYAHERVRRID